MQNQSEKQPKKPGFWQIVFSTLSAAFGVQNQKNLERDSRYGNIYVYIASGVIFTLIFVLAVILVVRAVLMNSGL